MNADAAPSPYLRLTGPSPCEAISSSPSRKPLLIDRPVRAPSISPYAAAGFNLSRRKSPRAAAPPRRSSPACWRRRRPQPCGGRDLRDLSPIGQAACRARPRRAEPHALHGSAVGAGICWPALADPEPLWLAASGELSSDQTEPCGEIAPAVEAFRPTDSGDKGGCDDRADARDCRQPPGFLVLFHPADELGVEGSDRSIEFRPLRPGGRGSARRTRSPAVGASVARAQALPATSGPPRPISSARSVRRKKALRSSCRVATPRR